MTVLRIDRFTADPARADELVRRRNALVAAVRDAVPGLLDARLARVDDRTWIDLWRWDSHANAQAAVDQARSGALPEAASAFEIATDVTTEFAEVVDER
jgi:Antibiotic biosynthesis monooxygenase